jgi:hypothetical protein
VNKKYGIAVVTVTLLTALGVAVVLCELLLRFLYPQTLGVWGQTRDGLILLRPTFDVYLEKFGTHVQTNSHGFRDGEHSVDKKEGVLRILLLGDSFMEALQVEFSDAFPALLERELGARLGCPVEVINAGVSGWGTDDEVTYLTRKGREFHPDVVLFAVTLHNDISDNLEGRYHTEEQGKLIDKPLYVTPTLTHLGLEARSYLASHSHLYQIAYQSWKSAGRPSAGVRLTNHVIELMRNNQNNEVKRGWWITQKLLEKAGRLAKAEGFNLATFLIPTIYAADSELYSELISAHRLAASDFNREKPVETVLDILAREGIRSINLLPEFRSRSNAPGQDFYIPGDGHFNKDGHQLAVSIVSKELAGMIREWGSADQCRPSKLMATGK